MENDVNKNLSADALGEDNADILAAKRQRAAASRNPAPSAVSAQQLRAQMNAARTPGQTRTPASAGTKPVPAKPAVQKPTAAKPTAAKPTAAKPPAAKPPAAKPTAAKPAVTKPAETGSASRTASPVRTAASGQTAGNSAQPKRTAPSHTAAAPVKTAGAAAGSVSRPAGTSSDVPKHTVPSETAARRTAAAQPAKPAAPVQKNASAAGTERPARQAEPAASRDAKTRSIPAVLPTPKKDVADTASRGASGIRTLIPYQQATLSKTKEEPKNKTGKPAAETRVTPVPKDATRVSSAAAVVPKKLPPKKEPEEEDESEGGNTIISVIKAITYIVAVVVISVFLAVFIILVGNDIYAFVKDETVVDVTVPEYATVNDISQLFYENGLIEYPTVFKIFTNLKMTEKEKANGIQFVAGNYSLSPMMNYEELIAAIKPKKPSGTSRITIPEGYTTDQIIDLMVSKGIGTREGYVDVINNHDFDYWFIDELEQNGWKEGRYYRLDGYLFPDTYEFYNASTEEVVIGKLLRRFNEVFVDSYVQKAKELGYTVDELLTLASMVEKEGGTQSDFFNISSVFNNRLNNPSTFPYLESDATIVYAIEHETGEHVNPTKEHTAYDSPYNTYTNTGLPPGPIANPSASAIRAALYPSETKYYYFYSVSSTVTLYATTYPEHMENIANAIAGTADTAPQEEEETEP